MHEIQTSSITENAIMVGVVLPHHQRWETEDNLFELKSLANTSGVQVIDELIQECERINPTYFIGKGKVDELCRMVKMHQVSTVIFDEDLAPAQARNLEKATGIKIVDRSTLILDIFAKHARTREAKTQVELAQLEHLLPRLTRQWNHLSRQVGGIGTKGPGETQLETDRRLVRRRIETLRKELQKIDQRRITRRKNRKDTFKASLIGYTNVGKSTIMNLLSGSDVLVEDQLFATLDSTVRRVELEKNYNILLSDTVGFIRKLPHRLIASFKGTLEEVAEADLLVHVVDTGHPAFMEQIKTVNEVIAEIGARDKPVLLVFNKIDLLKEKSEIRSLKQQYPNSVFVSAARQIGTQYLQKALLEFVEKHFEEYTVEIPLFAVHLIHKIHSLAVVTGETYSDYSVSLSFKTTEKNRLRILQIQEQALAHQEAESGNGFHKNGHKHAS